MPYYQENINWYNTNLANSPEWNKWIEQGRIPGDLTTPGAHSISDLAGFVADLRKQDKMISQYYELATGQKADDNVFKQYAQYANDPAMLQAAINKTAFKAPATGDYGASITQLVTDRLGRAPTTAELNYFGKQMEAGNMDEYTLNQFLEQTNEYQTKVSDTARAKLATELGGIDQAYLDKVQKSLGAQYNAQGRPGAGAFGSALIEAGKDLATQRTGYLAGLGYQDFLRGQGNLRSDYENKLNQMYNSQAQGASLGNESRQRYYSEQDYNRNLAGQERLMKLQQSMQPQQPSFLQGLIPGLIGAGASLGGAGIMAGAYNAGSGLTGKVFNPNSTYGSKLNLGY